MNGTRAINLPPAVVWLAVALVGVHVLRQFLDPDQDQWLLLAVAFIAERYGPLGDQLPGGAAARLWSPVSYAFLHADFMHLLVNLIWMASFGGALARRFAAVRFLLLALISAVAGAAAHYVAHATDGGIVIGASGAVSGMMAATARFAFSPGGPLAGGGTAASYRIEAEPILMTLRNRRALAFILIWFAVNLLFGLTGGLGANISGGIAWEAHIGGFLVGLLCFPLLDPVRGGQAQAE
jgi:membrane associated rhomboid family serine protease